MFRYFTSLLLIYYIIIIGDMDEYHIGFFDHWEVLDGTLSVVLYNYICAVGSSQNHNYYSTHMLHWQTEYTIKKLKG